MNPHKIESNGPTQCNPASGPPAPPPQDVEGFRAALSGVAGTIDDIQVEHQHDHEVLPEHRAPKGEQQDTDLNRENPALHRDRKMTAAAERRQQESTPDRHSNHAGGAPRKQRSRFGPHSEREDSMEPLAQLIAALRSRQSKPVTELNIVPRAPNPLRLSLQITGDADNFVVKARTTLPDDRRDEVRQSLHVLERMLTERLPAGMRITVTLLA